MFENVYNVLPITRFYDGYSELRRRVNFKENDGPSLCEVVYFLTSPLPEIMSVSFCFNFLSEADYL